MKELTWQFLGSHRKPWRGVPSIPHYQRRQYQLHALPGMLPYPDCRRCMPAKINKKNCTQSNTWLHICLPKGRHSEGPHKIQGCCSQKCSSGGMGWVGHAGVGWDEVWSGRVVKIIDVTPTWARCRMMSIVAIWVFIKYYKGWGGVSHVGVGWELQGTGYQIWETNNGTAGYWISNTKILKYWKY